LRGEGEGEGEIKAPTAVVLIWLGEWEK